MSDTIKASDVIQAALDVQGVPFSHQGRSPLLGFDCVGFVLHCLHAAGWVARSPETSYVADYQRIPDGTLLCDYLSREADEVPRSEARPGDLIAMRYGRQPQHLALLMPPPRGLEGLYMMHSIQGHGVVLHRYSKEDWNRTIAVYRIFGMED